MKILVIILAALIFTVFVFAGAVDLTGTWKGSTEVDYNPVDLTLVLKKVTDGYAGHITATGFADNEEIRDVQFKNNELSFSFTVYNGSEYLGVKISLFVTEDSMKGSWESEDGNFGNIIMEKTSD